MYPSAKSITLLPAATRTAAVADQAGTVVPNVGALKRMIVVCDITASGGAAGDTLDVMVDVKVGSKWINAIHFTQQAGNGAEKSMAAVLDPSNPGTAVVVTTIDAASGVVRPSVWGSQIRARYTLVNAGAGGQSHTFSVVAYGQY